MWTIFLRQQVACVALLLLCSGCALDEELRRDRPRPFVDTRAYRHSPERPRSDVSSYWRGGHGAPKMVVKLGEQRAYFYKGGKLAGVSKISSGREGYRTPPGRYKVIQKERDHHSNLYGKFVDDAGAVIKSDVDIRKDTKPPGVQFAGSPMPYFMRFHGGYGLHAGYLPGYAASHGCIRMPRFMAEQFYSNASIGTPVIVRR